jgi:hypothetical protein
MTALLEARKRRGQERDRRSQAEDIERLPPSSKTPAGGFTGVWDRTTETNGGAVNPAQADRLAYERERLARQVVKPPANADWRPTPTQRENDILGTTAAAITLRKLWDLSPINMNSFDPSTPPDPRVEPPANTVAPTVQAVGGFSVGELFVRQVGTWRGAPTYTQQWLRAGSPISGETGNSHTCAVEDIGLMISVIVFGTNAGGSVPATSAEVGPIVPAARAKAPASAPPARQTFTGRRR